MKKRKIIAVICSILFVAMSASQPAYGQQKKGSLSLIKDKSKVFVVKNNYGPVVLDYLSTHSDFNFVADKTEAEFLVSMSVGDHGARDIHPTQRNTTPNRITNTIEGPMIPQPIDPQITVISQKTYLNVFLIDSSGALTLVWQEGIVTPVAPSTHPSNLTNTPHLVAKADPKTDQVTTSLLKSFLRDLADVK